MTNGAVHASQSDLGVTVGLRSWHGVDLTRAQSTGAEKLMFSRGMECADHYDGRLAHLVHLTDYSGDPSRKRQTHREMGTQSHGSGLILTAGLPKEGHASLLGTWWSPAEREPRCFGERA